MYSNDFELNLQLLIIWKEKRLDCNINKKHISLTGGRIFSQAGNELGASSFPARNELKMLFQYTVKLGYNELNGTGRICSL
jgi:hypothetical protein